MSSKLSAVILKKKRRSLNNSSSSDDHDQYQKYNSSDRKTYTMYLNGSNKTHNNYEKPDDEDVDEVSNFDVQSTRERRRRKMMESNDKNDHRDTDSNAHDDKESRSYFGMKMMFSFSYEAAILALIVIIVICSLLLNWNQVKSFDQCAIDRFQEPKNIVNVHSSAESFFDRWFGRHGFYNMMVIAMAAGVLMLITWPTPPVSLKFARSLSEAVFQHHEKRKRIIEFNQINAFYTLYAIAWYYCSYILCSALKHILTDIACNKHANAVSGHYNFYFFANFTLLFIFVSVMNKRPASTLARRASEDCVDDTMPNGSSSNGSDDLPTSYNYSSNARTGLSKFLALSHFSPIRTYAFLALQVLLITSTLVNAYFTYAMGYHTPRQIVYGALLGLVSHLAFTYSIDIHVKRNVDRPYLRSVLYLFGFLLSVITFYITMVPSGFDVLFFGKIRLFPVLALVLSLVVTVFAWKLENTEQKL